MFRQDILERLRIDPGQVTLGQLMQDREAARHEIERLRVEIGHLRAGGTTGRGARAISSPSMGSGRNSNPSPFRPGTLISIKEVCGLLGISRSTIYKKLVEGIFPKPVPLGPRTVRWRVEEIEAWVEARATKS